VVAARTKIVDGAVGMVQMALDRLSKDQIVDLARKSFTASCLPEARKQGPVAPSAIAFSFGR